ncbi:MAG TPA: magnesium transporter, partial [Clostridiales bacterium]|nr:magnesium transporter [Clostridiales bacterium]
MAVGDIEMRDALKVLWKELRVAVLVGLGLSALNFVKILLFDRQTILIALTVCLSMLLIITLAKTIGGLLPMLARRIGIDPALMASPTIASLTDMISIITYFALASLILQV